MNRMLAGFAALVLSSLFSSMASAQGCPVTMRLTGPKNIKFDPGLTVGSVLWTGSVQSSGGYLDDCGNGYRVPPKLTYEGIGIPESGNIYPSGIPGIGYRVKHAGGFCSSKSWWPNNVCTAMGYGPTLSAHALVTELVKTGTITSGGALAGEFARVRHGSRTIYHYMWTGSVVVEPVAPTCVLTTPSVTVDLGIASSLELRDNGSSPSRSFDIRLSCSGGDGTRAANVGMALTDNTNPNNRSNLLSLTRDSTASGVAIRVMRNGMPVAFGAASSPLGYTYGGVFTIPMAAHYVQTGERVTAGSARGQATFTMNYW